MYLYKEGDLSQEKIYLKNQLVALCQELGYAGGVVPSNMASRNHLKMCIHTHWVVDAKSKEERNKIFCK